MAWYQYSWLILLSPLFAFAAIIFGTRMWDLATRQRVVAATAEHEAEEHGEADGDFQLIQLKGPPGEDLVFEDIENPKVPRLTPWARAGGYLSIVIMPLSSIYSGIFLLNTPRVLST